MTDDVSSDNEKKQLLSVSSDFITLEEEEKENISNGGQTPEETFIHGQWQPRISQSAADKVIARMYNIPFMIGNDIISGYYFFTSKGRLASEMLELMKILFTNHSEKLIKQGGSFLTIKNGKDVWMKQLVSNFLGNYDSCLR
ncbi:unnamed protein product [Chilo suppressalis]|uniref:Uncharacterized protein n=1 Tax=Chilo suppressalis TaxID=168631 RepID=A0ABN8B196_CHISP|nr:unnamed protein product [Chilo suppressalis]